MQRRGGHLSIWATRVVTPPRCSPRCCTGVGSMQGDIPLARFARSGSIGDGSHDGQSMPRQQGCASQIDCKAAYGLRGPASSLTPFRTPYRQADDLRVYIQGFGAIDASGRVSQGLMGGTSRHP